MIQLYFEQQKKAKISTFLNTLQISMTPSKQRRLEVDPKLSFLRTFSSSFRQTVQLETTKIAAHRNALS